MEGSVVPVSCQTPQQKRPKIFLPMVVLAAFFLSSSPVTYSTKLLEDAGSRVVPTVLHPCSDSREPCVGYLSLSHTLSSGPLGGHLVLPLAMVIFHQPKGKQLGISST